MGWGQYWDDSVPPKAYWYNDDLDESSWTAPEGFSAATTGENGSAAPTPVGDDTAIVTDWEEQWSEEDGKFYYYSASTDTSVWDKPEGFVSSSASGGWEEVFSEEHRENYFYNATTGETSWERPAGMAAAPEETEGGGGHRKSVSAGATQERRVSFARRPSEGRASLAAARDDDDANSLLLQGIQGGRGGGRGAVLTDVDLRKPAGRGPDGRRKSIFRMHQDDDHDDHDDHDHDHDGLPSDPQHSHGESDRGADVDVASVDPDSTLDELGKLLAGVSFEQYAARHIKDFRRKSIFNKAAEPSLVHSAISFSPDETKAPLIALATPQQAELAIRCSKHILSYMGNRKASKSPVEQATSIVESMLKAPQDSRDELYLQICKQIRGNPDRKAIEMGWQLMIICLASFPPSTALAPHLMANCFSNVLSHKPLVVGGGGGGSSSSSSSGENSSSNSDESFASDFEISRCAELALRACVMSRALPARVEMLSHEELESLRKGTRTNVLVSLLDGSCKTLSVDSWTSVKKLATQMALELGLHASNTACFALYESNGSGSERVLGPDERVLYLSSLWQHDGQASGRRASPPQTFRFLYQIQHFLDATSKGSVSVDNDAAAVRLFYLQACHDVLSARYPCTEQEAFIFAALQAQEMLGDMPTSVPPQSADIVSVLQGKSLHTILNRRFLGHSRDSHEQLQQRRRGVEVAIFSAYSRLQGYSPADARLAYLHLARAMGVYGATYFKVQAPRGGGGGGGGIVPAEVYLAVTPKGVVVLQQETASYLAEYDYQALESWGHKHHAVALVTTLGEKVYFKTQQSLQVVELIDKYVKILSSK